MTTAAMIRTVTVRRYAEFEAEPVVAEAVSPASEALPNIAPDIQSWQQATKSRVTEEHESKENRIESRSKRMQGCIHGKRAEHRA